MGSGAGGARVCGAAGAARRGHELHAGDGCQLAVHRAQEAVHAHQQLAGRAASGLLDGDVAHAHRDAQLVVVAVAEAQLQHAVQQPNPALVPPAPMCMSQDLFSPPPS